MNQKELSETQNNANPNDYLVQTLQFTDQKLGYQEGNDWFVKLICLHTDGARTLEIKSGQTSTCKF